MVAIFMGDDIEPCKIAALARHLCELVVKADVDIDRLISRTIKRPHANRACAAASVEAPAGGKVQSWLLKAHTLLGENLLPSAVERAERIAGFQSILVGVANALLVLRRCRGLLGLLGSALLHTANGRCCLNWVQSKHEIGDRCDHNGSATHSACASAGNSAAAPCCADLNVVRIEWIEPHCFPLERSSNWTVEPNGAKAKALFHN